MPGDRLDDQRGHVEGEPEGEEEGHVPELPAQVVVAVGLYARLWDSHEHCLGCSRRGRWWRWFIVVLVVVDKVVVIKVIWVTGLVVVLVLVRIKIVN